MLAKFLQWIMTKNTRLEYMKDHARCLAGFLVTMFVVVTTLMGMPGFMQNRKWNRNPGRSAGDPGHILAGYYYAPFGIQR